MARRKVRGRPVNGVLVVNKVSGMTSNEALQQAKRLLFAAKAGHTGSLDPMATGVLPVCFGEATKFSQYLLDADKRYRATIQLGVTTNTSDAEGEILESVDTSGVSEQQLQKALEQFRGEIEQTPSMFSALKHKGTPLYKLARKGQEVERPVRQVTIYELHLLSFTPGDRAQVEIEVFCSKGTYIRSIAEDLGRALGVGGHIASLHRLEAGPFQQQHAVDLDTLSAERGEEKAHVLDHYLMPVDSAVSSLPKLVLPDDSGFYLRRGQAVMDPQVFKVGEPGELVRVFVEAGNFIGLGEITDEGLVTPKRLVNE